MGRTRAVGAGVGAKARTTRRSASLRGRAAGREEARRMGRPLPPPPVVVEPRRTDAGAEGGKKAPVSVSAAAGGAGAAGAAAGRKESRERGEPPRKRTRVSTTVRAPAPHAGLSVNPERFDVVAKGLIGDTEARALVHLCVSLPSLCVSPHKALTRRRSQRWMRECEPFCAVLDAGYDTYESMRKRSPFLFNTVIYTALRMSERNAPPSKELLAAAEETRRFARDMVFENNPDLEVVQGACRCCLALSTSWLTFRFTPTAMLIMACYHQEPCVSLSRFVRSCVSPRRAPSRAGWETRLVQLELRTALKSNSKTLTKTDSPASTQVCAFGHEPAAGAVGEDGDGNRTDRRARVAGDRRQGASPDGSAAHVDLRRPAREPALAQPGPHEPHRRARPRCARRPGRPRPVAPLCAGQRLPPCRKPPPERHRPQDHAGHGGHGREGAIVRRAGRLRQ